MKKTISEELKAEQLEKFEVVKKHEAVLEKYGVEHSMRPAVSMLIENQVRHNPNLLNETNDTSDVAKIDKNIMPMLMRQAVGTVGTQLFGHQPLSADTGCFFYEQTFYTNDSVNPITDHADSKYIVLADASAFTVNGDISGDSVSGNDGVGKVRYIEGNRLLVEMVSGTFVNGGGVDNTAVYAASETTIADYAEAEVGFRVFSNYTGLGTVAQGESASTNIKEIEFGISKETVTAESHKMKMRYTHEVVNALRDYQGLDGEAVTNASGGFAFTQELNLRAFDLIDTYATEGGTTAFVYGTADGRWELEKIKNLLAMINRVSSEILVDSHIGCGNYLVIDPTTWASLSALGYIDSSMLGGMAQPEKDPFVGTMLGRYRVYVNIFERSLSINMGYKDFSGDANAELRAGAFFCPYLPIQSIRTVSESSGQPVKFFSSSYAFKKNPFADKGNLGASGNAFFRKISIDKLSA